MFTGIINYTGVIAKISKNGVIVKAPEILRKLKTGGSVAVDGACLTVTEVLENGFSADIMPVTIQKTVFKNRKKNDIVNLELPMQSGDRFEGHFISGHIEGTAELIEQKIADKSYLLKLKMPEKLTKYIVPEGSIALNGISLTVANISGDELIVSIIPHTWDITNLHELKIGDKVNVETDLLAKYAEKLAQ
jgi:riboflavin synthase